MSDRTEILIALQNIDDKMQEILDILKIVHRESVDSAQERVLSSSPLRKKILNLCNGDRSVSDIAETLGKSIQQISNNISLLRDVGLVREVREGKEKRYIKIR
jgi:DNA-binding transcriptional ArsR family regulator